MPLHLSSILSRRGSKLKIYLLTLLSSISLVSGLFFLNNFFLVKEIKIESAIPQNQVKLGQNQIRGLESLKKSNLLFISPEEIRKLILAQNAQIKNVIVRKKYPDSLLLSVESSSPLTFLKLNTGFAVLGEDAKILYKIKAKNADFPTMNFYQKFDYYRITVGEILDYKEIVTAVYFLKKLKDLNLKVESIDINNVNMIVCNLKDKKIFFTTEKDKDKQTFELETLIKQFKIEAKDFKVLDLRFDKPIVKF